MFDFAIVFVYFAKYLQYVFRVHEMFFLLYNKNRYTHAHTYYIYLLTYVLLHL